MSRDDRTSTSRQARDPWTGPRQAAERDRAVDDGVEAAVAALKRLHHAKGPGDAPSQEDESRGLLYDLYDANSRYVRNVLGILARANEQIFDFASGTWPTAGSLTEKRIELRWSAGGTTSTFRLQNAGVSTVAIDLPAELVFEPFPVADDEQGGGGAPRPRALVPAYRAALDAAGIRGADPNDFVPCAATVVPAGATLEVEMTLDTAALDPRRSWCARGTIRTDAARDVALDVWIERAGISGAGGGGHEEQGRGGEGAKRDETR